MRVAVITGGSSGIGAALARSLTETGWRCVLLARGSERLEQAGAEIGAETERCDVGDRLDVERAASGVAGRHKAIHLLVNNAGISAGGTFLDLAPQRIEEVMRTNYLGAVWCTRAFLPLLEAGVPSQVVNVVSVAGLVTRRVSGPYSAAKHAELAFSRLLTGELAARGIRVLTVNPGPVDTPGFNRPRGPIGRRIVLQPEDVSAAILKALERERSEIVLPPYLRLAAIADAAAPHVVGTVLRRLSERAGARRGRGPHRR